VLVVARFENIFLFHLFIVVIVIATALGQECVEHVSPEAREREARGTEAATDEAHAAPDGVQDLAHRERRRDHDGNDETDDREERRAGRADHRAQDLGEVLADRATGSMTCHAIVRRDEMDERREREHTEQRPRDHERRHRGLPAEQHANRGRHPECDQEVAAQPGQAVEQARGRAAERPHHHRVGLKRDHRDQEEQAGSQPDHPDHLAPAVLATTPASCAALTRRTTANLSVFGHGCRSAPWSTLSYMGAHDRPTFSTD
jgi:hypothetical protein